jgi:DNA transposition AAA+ family ATPase
MVIQPSVNVLSEQVYNEDLHNRFLLWKDQTGNSEKQIARMIARSTALVSQYINKIYVGDIQEIEKDVASLLRREEDFEHPLEEKKFCSTFNARLIWEVLQFCDEHHTMGVAVQPSGSGKTATCNEYKRQNRATVLITADLTRRSISGVLGMIAKKLGSTPRPATNDVLLDTIIERLRDSGRLVIIDEAHLLRWENFEVIRNIHDVAGVGIVYVGQERLYDQMKGDNRRGYLFDQIYGRITIKRDRFKIEREDVKMLVEALRPGLDKACIDFLFEIAQMKKKLRNVTNTLNLAESMHRLSGKPWELDLLREAYRFLVKEDET